MSLHLCVQKEYYATIYNRRIPDFIVFSSNQFKLKVMILKKGDFVFYNNKLWRVNFISMYHVNPYLIHYCLKSHVGNETAFAKGQELRLCSELF